MSVRIGFSSTSLDEDFHLTGEGVAGCGGRVAGDSRAVVAANMFGARNGGTRKWRCSSLI